MQVLRNTHQPMEEDDPYVAVALTTSRPVAPPDKGAATRRPEQESAPSRPGRLRPVGRVNRAGASGGLTAVARSGEEGSDDSDLDAGDLSPLPALAAWPGPRQADDTRGEQPAPSPHAAAVAPLPLLAPGVSAAALAIDSALFAAGAGPVPAGGPLRLPPPLCDEPGDTEVLLWGMSFDSAPSSPLPLSTQHHHHHHQQQQEQQQQHQQQQYQPNFSKKEIKETQAQRSSRSTRSSR
jgi:hypothetical protein